VCFTGTAKTSCKAKAIALDPIQTECETSSVECRKWDSLIGDKKMGVRIVLGIVVMMVGIVLPGLTHPTQTLPAAERISPAEKGRSKGKKKDSICVDVVIEEVDFSANTITARSTVYIVPPHDNVGGAVFKTGTTDSHQDKATKYFRLPVMPQAKLTEKKPKAGQHAILRLELLHQGLVVDGIEAFTGLERIGVDWLDAPRTKKGN
jgi:hypothetical protein